MPRQTQNDRDEIRKEWNEGFGIFSGAWYERHLLNTLDECDAVEIERNFLLGLLAHHVKWSEIDGATKADHARLGLMIEAQQ